jgi:hypothetical protein
MALESWSVGQEKQKQKDIDDTGQESNCLMRSNMKPQPRMA